MYNDQVLWLNTAHSAASCSNTSKCLCSVCTPPTPAPTPLYCGSAQTSNTDGGCTCNEPLEHKVSDTRRRRYYYSRRRVDVSPTYHFCVKNTPSPTPAPPTPGPTPVPPTPVPTPIHCGLDWVANTNADCTCHDPFEHKITDQRRRTSSDSSRRRSYFSDRRRAPAPPTYYFCLRATPAPTPQPTFAVGGFNVVVPTKLTGFTPATFTLAPQLSYRLTIAVEAGTAVDKVILGNIRVATRRLGEHHGRRAAAAAVDFDTSISVADTAAATAMKSTVASITPAAIKATFLAELKAAKASGAFPDLDAANVDALAATISVTKQAPREVTVTAAPTPPPTPMQGPSTCSLKLKSKTVATLCEGGWALILSSNLSRQTISGDFTAGASNQAPSTTGEFRIGATGAELSAAFSAVKFKAKSGSRSHTFPSAANLAGLDSTCSGLNCAGSMLGPGLYWHGSKGFGFGSSHFGAATTSNVHFSTSASSGQWYGHFHRNGRNTGVYAFGNTPTEENEWDAHFTYWIQLPTQTPTVAPTPFPRAPTTVPTPRPSSYSHAIQLAVTVAGFNASTFTNVTRLHFRVAVATSFGISLREVVITNTTTVASQPPRTDALQQQLLVSFELKTNDPKSLVHWMDKGGFLRSLQDELALHGIPVSTTVPTPPPLSTPAQTWGELVGSSCDANGEHCDRQVAVTCLQNTHKCEWTTLLWLPRMCYSNYVVQLSLHSNNVVESTYFEGIEFQLVYYDNQYTVAFSGNVTKAKPKDQQVQWQTYFTDMPTSYQSMELQARFVQPCKREESGDQWCENPEIGFDPTVTPYLRGLDDAELAEWRALPPGAQHAVFKTEGELTVRDCTPSLGQTAQPSRASESSVSIGLGIGLGLAMAAAVFALVLRKRGAAGAQGAILYTPSSGMASASGSAPGVHVLHTLAPNPINGGSATSAAGASSKITGSDATGFVDSAAGGTQPYIASVSPRHAHAAPSTVITTDSNSCNVVI
jgi:hypothetical protein